MTLHSPFEISPRLLPALKIGGAWVQLEIAGEAGGRTVYRWTIDLKGGGEFSGSDLRSGVGGGSLQEGFESLLSFLGAAGEEYHYEPENTDLFPKAVNEWAYQNSDEISSLQLELEENKGLIEA